MSDVYCMKCGATGQMTTGSVCWRCRALEAVAGAPPSWPEGAVSGEHDPSHDHALAALVERLRGLVKKWEELENRWPSDDFCAGHGWCSRELDEVLKDYPTTGAGS
jgi:hypothetical protein